MHPLSATIAADYRSRRSQCSFQARRTVHHSPTANDVIRSKVSRISSKHEQLKTAFSQLKSQISTGLLEAEEVFASLAIPLMKLVGLKTVEMSEEGRFSSIIINNRDSSHPIYRDFQWDGAICEEASGSPVLSISRPYSHQRTFEFEEPKFTAKATKVCEELMHKQRMQLMQLVELLKQIEIQVNSSKDDILQTLADNRQSLKRLYQKVVTYIYENHKSNDNGMSLDTVKLLRFTFEHFGYALGSVEIGVETLISNLASKMCHPMVNYVNFQKSELVAGTCQSLPAMLEEIETAIKIRSQELEDAKKKVKAVEESRLNALRQLKESEAKLKEMTERQIFIRESYTHSRGLPAPEKLSHEEADSGKDERLLWELLRNKRKLQEPNSPFAAIELVGSRTNSKNRRSSRIMPPRMCKQILGNHSAALSPTTPKMDFCVPLGSSPSSTISQVVPRKRSRR